MKRLLIIMLVLFCSVWCGSAWGASLYADNALSVGCTGDYSISGRDCSGSDGDAYSTLDGGVVALAAGSVGDILYIRESETQYIAVYRALNDNNQSILGYTENPLDVIIDCTVATRWLDVTSDNISFKYLTIQNASHTNGPLFFIGASPIIEKNILINNEKHLRLSGVAAPIIKKNHFKGSYDDLGFSLYLQNTDDGQIINNIFEPSLTNYLTVMGFRDTGGDFSTGNIFSKNTIGGVYGYLIDSDGDSNTATWTNNIILGIGADDIDGRAYFGSNGAGMSFDYNLAAPFTDANQSPVQTNKVEALPKFSGYPREGLFLIHVDDTTNYAYAQAVAGWAYAYGYPITWNINTNVFNSGIHDPVIIDILNKDGSIGSHSQSGSNTTRTDFNFIIDGPAGSGINFSIDQSNSDSSNWTWTLLLIEDYLGTPNTVATYTQAGSIQFLWQVVADITDNVAGWTIDGSFSSSDNYILIKTLKGSGGDQDASAGYEILAEDTLNVVDGFVMSPFMYVEVKETKDWIENHIQSLACDSCGDYSVDSYVSPGNGMNDNLANAIYESGYLFSRGGASTSSRYLLGDLAIYQTKVSSHADKAILYAQLMFLAQNGGITNYFTHDTGETSEAEFTTIFELLNSSKNIQVLSADTGAAYIIANGTCIDDGDSGACDGSTVGKDVRFQRAWTNAGNYKLQSTSPCVDVGTNESVLYGETTFYETSQFGEWDIGAYEVVPSTGRKSITVGGCPGVILN